MNPNTVETLSFVAALGLWSGCACFLLFQLLELLPR